VEKMRGLFLAKKLRPALFALFSGHVQLIFYSDSENIHLFTRSVLLSAAKNDLTEAELLRQEHPAEDSSGLAARLPGQGPL
jgi:hypothetical protein